MEEVRVSERPLDERYGKVLYEIADLLNQVHNKITETQLEWEVNEENKLEPEIMLLDKVRDKVAEAMDASLARLYEYEHG